MYSYILALKPDDITVIGMFATPIVYLAVPLILTLIKPILSNKQIKIVATVNSIVGFLIFSFVRLLINSTPGTGAPALLWGTVGYFIMKHSFGEKKRINNTETPIDIKTFNSDNPSFIPEKQTKNQHQPNVENVLSLCVLPDNSANTSFTYNNMKYDKMKFVDLCIKEFSSSEPQTLAANIISLESYISSGNENEYYIVQLESLYKAFLTTYPNEYNIFLEHHGKPPFKTGEEPEIKEELPKTEEIKNPSPTPVQEKTETKQIPPVETANRFCQYCGQPIDKLSKRCMGCGRKYFFVR